jgi:hypothetical protein
MNPGPIDEGAKIAGGVVEALKREPVSLALVVLNVAFLLIFAFVFHEISNGRIRQDTLLAEISKACIAAPAR